MPLRGLSDACFTTFLMSLYLAAFSRRQVRSTTDTLGVGTRKAMPVSFPFSSGMTLPTALAAPVEAGMMFWAAPRPSCHSFPEGPSTVFWVAVMAWTVVPAFSMVVKTPVDSTTYSAPASPHLMLAGSRPWKMVMGFPLMTSFPFSALTGPWNLPWVESYWNM
uniref:Uncharacterized protein n=1 Tax=Suricata suricatta TaxID=37032 RepID=A0A673TN26_SURSU